jgi:hydrogenase maturation protease
LFDGINLTIKARILYTFSLCMGTVRVFEGAEFVAFLVSGRRSVHEVGFADLMDIARLQDCLPANRALIGIQPEVLGWGESTGESVTAALPRAADSAVDLIRKWRTG